MPIYVYKCDNCGNQSEVIQPVDASAPETCSVCGETETMHKLITSASFVLKGSGWYATDFAKKGGSSSCSACSEGSCSSGASSSESSTEKPTKETKSDKKTEKKAAAS